MILRNIINGTLSPDMNYHTYNTKETFGEIVYLKEENY
jgi:hypothetical protein